MTRRTGLDEHIVKKYNSVSTLASSNFSDQTDKLWGTLGSMAMMNLASQRIRKHN